MYTHLALGSWGNPSSNEDMNGDLLHKASCEEDPGKAALGRRRERGVNFLAKSCWLQLAKLVETLTLMFDGLKS